MLKFNAYFKAADQYGVFVIFLDKAMCTLVWHYLLVFISHYLQLRAEVLYFYVVFISVRIPRDRAPPSIPCRRRHARCLPPPRVEDIGP